MEQDFLETEIQKSEMLHKIGTLKEKTLHSMLKHYIEPDESKQEIKVGRYYVDILNENGVIEVQTQNFNLLRKKLTALLPEHKVTIVYPITYEKWLYWINEETGEISKKRKSPKKGTFYRSLFELYKIKPYLTEKNLSLRLMLINMDEYRLLNGWSEDKKRGSSRYDRIPSKVVDECWIEKLEDYRKLIPDMLVEPFTTKDYAAETKLSLKAAQTGLNVLFYVGAVERVGKKGSAYLYQRT